MKKLIICDTFYQVIVAIQLRLTLFKNDEVDVWISDHSNGAEKLVENLKNEKVFNDIYYIESKKIDYPKRKIQSILNIFQYGFGYKRIIVKPKLYDEILYYGLDLLICGLQSYYDRKKHQVVWSRYEEGLFSYETDFSYGKAVKMQQKMRRIIGKEVIDEKIQNYYCFYPQFKENKYTWNLIEVPGLNNNLEEIKPILEKGFGYRGFEYTQKYIYFASSSDIDGHSYGETQIVLDIARIVGNDNLLVKMHPRDNRDIFTQNGISTMDSYGIPWEVYQLCSDMNNKVLLTVDSGSFINVCAINPSDIKCCFLFPCVESEDEKFNMRKGNIENMLRSMKQNKMCNMIQSIDDIEKIKFL